MLVLSISFKYYLNFLFEGISKEVLRCLGAEPKFIKPMFY